MSSELEEDATFLRSNNIPALINEVMLHLLMKKPTDPVASLREFLATVDSTLYGPGKGQQNGTALATPLEELRKPQAAAAAAAPAAGGVGGDEDYAEDLHDLEAYKGNLDAEIRSQLARGVRRFNLSKNQLTTVPSSLAGNRDVVSLSMEENQLDSLESVMTLPNLRYFNMSCNPQLKTIPDDFAQKLPLLTKIEAYKGSYSGQLPDVLCQLKHLTCLNFYNNSVLKPMEHIGDMTSLTELNLASNKMMAIKPESLTNLHNLKRLALFWNRLLRLPSLAPLRSLEILQLNGNQLPEMPTLGTHPKLEEINVNENKITAFNETLFNQVSLDTLVAGKNLLTDATICAGPLWHRLENLKKIQMPSNKLTKIPDCFLDLPSLLCLDLNENEITELPEDIDRLQRKRDPINHIFLADNRFKHLPAAMAKLTDIKRVAFRNCPLDLTHQTTKATYDTIEAAVRSRGIDGKFLDSKRTGDVPMKRPAAGPATLGASLGSPDEPRRGAKPPGAAAPGNGGGISLQIG